MHQANDDSVAWVLSLKFDKFVIGCSKKYPRNKKLWSCERVDIVRKLLLQEFQSKILL